MDELVMQQLRISNWQANCRALINHADLMSRAWPNGAREEIQIVVQRFLHRKPPKTEEELNATTFERGDISSIISTAGHVVSMVGPYGAYWPIFLALVRLACIAPIGDRGENGQQIHAHLDIVRTKVGMLCANLSAGRDPPADLVKIGATNDQ